jgi:hypothetical protein
MLRDEVQARALRATQNSKRAELWVFALLTALFSMPNYLSLKEYATRSCFYQLTCKGKRKWPFGAGRSCSSAFRVFVGSTTDFWYYYR